MVTSSTPTTVRTPTSDSTATGYSDLTNSEEIFIMPEGISWLAAWSLSGIKANQEDFL